MVSKEVVIRLSKCSTVGKIDGRAWDVVLQKRL
jgi:hypothetical protein